MRQTIQHAHRIEGALKVPGDKSISHRALIMGAAARGKHVVDGIAEAADVNTTAQCLRELGCLVERMPDGRTLVLSHELKENVALDAGNSGTTARLMAGLVAGLGIECTIDGDDSLRRRPMKRIVDPLLLMGAAISASAEGTLPLKIGAGALRGIRYDLPVASAQVKSAILLAGLFADGETTVVEPVATRDHTERMLEWMGVPVCRDGGAITVVGGQSIDGSHITVPGDFSSAAFFIVATSCVGNSELFLPTTGMNPTRTGLLRVFEDMGANIAVENETVVSGEPVGDITVRSAPLRGIEITDPTTIASVIDEIPIIAVAATRADGVTEIRGAGELRHKECDRIHAVVHNLTAMGADIVEHEDGFTITGPCALRGAEVRSFGDHRIVMAMTVAGMLADGTTEIDDAFVVDISYPGFYNDLLTVVR